MKRRKKDEVPRDFHKLSLHVDKKEFRFLKMCCVKLDVSMVDFCNRAILEKVDEWENKWMAEKFQPINTDDCIPWEEAKKQMGCINEKCI